MTDIVCGPSLCLRHSLTSTSSRETGCSSRPPLDEDSSIFCKFSFNTYQSSVAASFLVSDGNVLYQYIMLSAFAILGIIFICVGLFCANSKAMEDLSKAETAKAVGKGAAKGAASGA